MLYNIPCRIYILSTLSLCISGIVSTATATSSETKISNEKTLVVTTNRSASNLWESPATIQVIDQQTLQNSTNASIADNLQDIPGVEITDNSLAGRKQIRIRGWICPYISRHLLSLNPLQARCRRYSRGER